MEYVRSVYCERLKLILCDLGGFDLKLQLFSKVLRYIVVNLLWKTTSSVQVQVQRSQSVALFVLY